MVTLNFSVNGHFYTGFYEIVGAFIVVECQYGVRRAVLGLQKPQKVARRLLRILVLQSEAGRQAVAVAVPEPAAIRHARAKEQVAVKPASALSGVH